MLGWAFWLRVTEKSQLWQLTSLCPVPGVLMKMGYKDTVPWEA